MPWNDNSNPGPWGSPGPQDGGKGGKGGSGSGGKGGGEGGGPPEGSGGSGGKGPWGSLGGGGSGEPPRGPRPVPPSGGGPRRPGGPLGPKGGAEFEDLIRQLNERFRRWFGGGGPSGRPRASVMAAVAGAAFAAWALSGLYIVQPNQEAVVTRFGAYTRSEGPGLRYHLPGPIEAVEKVAVTDLKALNVGGANATDVPEESLMLTGDENIVDLNFTVQWRIADAASYIFRLTDTDAAVKMVAESAMREVVGKTPVQSILSTGRGQVQAQVAELMQRTLDSWGAGVSVVEVQIREANPPQEVIAAFRDVNNAGQDAEAAVNEANTYRNRVINEARGDAARITQAAVAYREQVIREAQGEAERFAAIEAEYRRAPGVTRQRLYTETMERVLRNSNKVVIDTPAGGTAPIVLPPDLLRGRGQAQQAAPQPAQPAQPQAGAAQ